MHINGHTQKKAITGNASASTVTPSLDRFVRNAVPSRWRLISTVWQLFFLCIHAFVHDMYMCIGQNGNFNNDTQALVIYNNCNLCRRAPQQCWELLAYTFTHMLMKIKASQQYDGLHCISYDTNYRITVAASGNKSWSHLDTDLYTWREKPLSMCIVCNSTYCVHSFRMPLKHKEAGSSQAGRG